MKINLAQLTTAALDTLASRTINSSKNGNYTVVANHDLLERLEIEHQKYNSVFGKQTFSGKGKEVAEADIKRDKLFAGMKGIVASYSKMEIVPGFSEAVSLYKIFKNYGLDLDKYTYAVETAKLTKLIEDLEKEENLTHVNTLHLGEIFTLLKAAQTDFEIIYAQQAEANADLRQMPSASSQRKNLEAALRNYFSLLTAMQNIEGWKMIYSDIKELVKSAKTNSNISNNLPLENS